MEKTITLGTTVRDSVTGFTGIATSSCQILNGQTRIGITSQSLDRDGYPLKEQWFNIGDVSAVSYSAPSGGN